MNLQVIEKNGERVLLTSQLAESYGTDVRTISNNFNRNKERYTEGKHFYCLAGDELKEFKTIHQNDEQFKHVSVIYLWTEKGALLHAKSLGTDKAWEVYDYLVESYFNKKIDKINLANAILNPDTIIQLATALKEEQSKSKLLEVKVSELTVDKQIMQPKPYHFSNECDMINKLVTGMTAKKFREAHNIPKGESIRPYLTDEQIALMEKLQKADVGLLIAFPNYEDRKRHLEWYMMQLHKSVA